MERRRPSATRNFSSQGQPFTRWSLVRQPRAGEVAGHGYIHGYITQRRRRVAGAMGPAWSSMPPSFAHHRAMLWRR
jgi:hypothetical protein